MGLNNLAIQNAKPRASTYKMYDGNGLYLEINPKGVKGWRFKYMFNDKEKRISLGPFPEISLSKARELLREVRRQVAEGIDPSQLRKEVKEQDRINQNNTLEAVARDWWKEHMKDKADSHKDKVIRRFENYVFPYIGKRKISELTTPEIAAVVKKISEVGIIDTAKRTLQTLGQVFRYAVQNGYALRDVTSDLKGLLPSTKTKHMATLLKPGEISDFLKACELHRGRIVVKSALELAPLVFARPGELRHAKWSEVNFELREWTYIVNKGGIPRPHTVPLSSQAMDIFKRMHNYSQSSIFVFPNEKNWNRAMSEASVNAAIKSIGYSTQDDITGHGFRAMARTILHETLKYNPYAIEHQLSHSVPDTLGTAYNRTKFMDERILIMQGWADYLDSLKGISKTIIYFDCEFTALSKDFNSIKLISAGFTSENGKELYFELHENFTEGDCSEFTQNTVLPHLNNKKYGHSNLEAAKILKKFIESFPGKVKLATDAPKYDWHLVAKLLKEENCWPLNLINDPLNSYSEDVSYEIDAYFKSNIYAIKHHALSDAIALMVAVKNAQINA